MKAYYIQVLEMLIYLLEKNGDNDHWIEWLKDDISYFEEDRDVHHHILAYGGMGSFNDLYLSNLNQEEIMLFDIMKEFSYQMAFLYKRIHKDIYILEKEVLNDVLYKYKEQRNPIYIFILDGLQSGNLLDFYLNGKQYKNIRNIIFHRDSVCMADDMNENTRTYACHINLANESLMTIVKEYNFLPHVSGNDVVWVVLNHNGKEIFSYYTKDDKLIEIAHKKSIDEICEGKYELYFKYYTSPLERGYDLFKKYHGDGHNMWHEGVITEYLHCSITEKQEKEWKKEL